MIKNTGKNWLIIIGAATFILSLYIFFKKTPPGIYWGDNSRQMYTISYKETADAWSLTSQKSSRKLKLNATLNFRIFEKSKTIKAGMQLSKMTLLLNGKRYDSLDKIYTTIFLLEFKKDGEILTFHFSNELARNDEKDIASIIKTLQLIVEKSITAAWDTSESDMLGKYYAEYIYGNGTIYKNKLHYFSINDENGLPNKHLSSIIRNSIITAAYGEPSSWIKSASIDERVSVFSGDDSYTTYDKALRLRKKKFKAKKNIFIWKYKGTYDELINIWNHKEKNTISFTDKQRLEELKFVYGSATSKAITYNIKSSIGKVKEKAVSDLADLISIIPGESDKFDQLFTEVRLRDNDKNLLINVLAKTGHHQAQKTLCRIMTSTGLDYNAKNSAAVALGIIKNPEQETIDELWITYEKYILQDPSLSGNAIASLAEISQSLNINNNKQKKEQGEHIREKILSQFKEAKTTGHIEMLLKAAGRIDHDDSIKIIENYVDSSSITLRIAAISSLKDIEDKEADKILIEKFTEEDTITVKIHIMKILLERKTNEKIIDDIIGLIPQQNNTIIRELMYLYLLKAKDHNISTDRLIEIKKEELSTTHQKLIDEIIKYHHSKKN